MKEIIEDLQNSTEENTVYIRAMQKEIRALQKAGIDRDAEMAAMKDQFTEILQRAKGIKR